MNARVGMTAAAVTLGIWLGADVVAGAAEGGFTFSPPPGWIDISKGAPEAQRKAAPPALLAQAENPAMAFVAFEPGSEADGFIENVNAVVRTGKHPPPVTREGLAEIEKGLVEQLAPQGMSYRSLGVDVVKVAGVTSGRIVGEIKGPNGASVTTIQYTIPGEMSHAVLTFTTTPDKRAHYEPIFEAAAQATKGAVEAPSLSDRKSTQLGTIAGGVAGALVAFFAMRRRRQNKVAAPPLAAP